MSDAAAIRAEADRLLAHFVAAGAEPVDVPVLQPAATMLDLYGEDIRARAYVAADPLRGEQMLRPDFTVPVALRHMAEGRAPARYAYAGPVFRKQEDDPERPNEYLQAGFEIFDGADAAGADADVFSTIAGALQGLGLQPATGDIGLVRAAVIGLGLSADRQAALLRHIWRPRRFRALIDRFAGRRPPTAVRAALLERAAAGDEVVIGAGPEIGKRSVAEVRARLDRLLHDAAEPPLPTAAVDLLDEVMTLREPSPAALSRLADIAVDLRTLRPAVDRLARRLDALAARGVDVTNLPFEASFGRTTLEYYDGFVFGFSAPGRPDLPPVATGGRYDALTRLLGGGREAHAVGGMIRPAVVLATQEAR